MNLHLVHLVFHVSMLKKCISYLESILPIERIDVMDNLSEKDVSVEILDRQMKGLRNKQ